MASFPDFADLSFDTRTGSATTTAGPTWETPEGIAVKPVYVAADIEGADFIDGIVGCAFTDQ